MGSEWLTDILVKKHSQTTRVQLGKLGQVVHRRVDHDPQVTILVVLGVSSLARWLPHTVSTSSREKIFRALDMVAGHSSWQRVMRGMWLVLCAPLLPVKRAVLS